jgi:hypothetical protein
MLGQDVRDVARMPGDPAVLIDERILVLPLPGKHEPMVVAESLVREPCDVPFSDHRGAVAVLLQEPTQQG